MRQLWSKRTVWTGGASVLGLALGVGFGLSSAIAQTAYAPSATADPSSAAADAPAAGVRLAQRRDQIFNITTIPVEMTPTAAELASGLAVDDSRPSSRDMTVPSLWWPEEQAVTVGPDQVQRMVIDWVARRRPSDGLHHVDIAVNGQIWNQLNYIEQYAFLAQFGQAAKSYGYHTRVITGSAVVGGYVCDFDPSSSFDRSGALSPSALSSTACTVGLDYLGRGSIGGRTSRGLL